MKIFTFCIVSTCILSVTSVSSQNNKEEQRFTKTSSIKNLDTNKEEIKLNHPKLIAELKTSSHILDTSETKNTQETINTTIILTEETKEEPIRTTIDFF